MWETTEKKPASTCGENCVGKQRVSFLHVVHDASENRDPAEEKKKGGKIIGERFGCFFFRGRGGGGGVSLREVRTVNDVKSTYCNVGVSTKFVVDVEEGLSPGQVGHY